MKTTGYGIFSCSIQTIWDIIFQDRVGINQGFLKVMLHIIERYKKGVKI